MGHLDGLLAPALTRRGIPMMERSVMPGHLA
jgi:hypothetical protein